MGRWRRTQRTPGVASVEISTDTALVAHALVDPAAFDALMAEYRESVLRYCFYRLGAWEDAEDAAQEVLIRVAANLGRYSSGRAGFKTWVFAIARNETVDVHRKRQRSRDLPFPEVAPWFDPGPSPEEEVVAAGEQELLHSLLITLPPDQRAVLELRAADLTTKEIATVLGRREEHIRKLQERALTRLRSELLTASASTGGGRDV